MQYILPIAIFASSFSVLFFLDPIHHWLGIIGIFIVGLTNRPITTKEYAEQLEKANRQLDGIRLKMRTTILKLNRSKAKWFDTITLGDSHTKITLWIRLTLFPIATALAMLIAAHSLTRVMISEHVFVLPLSKVGTITIIAFFLCCLPLALTKNKESHLVITNTFLLIPIWIGGMLFLDMESGTSLSITIAIMFTIAGASKLKVIRESEFGDSIANFFRWKTLATLCWTGAILGITSPALTVDPYTNPYALNIMYDRENGEPASPPFDYYVDFKTLSLHKYNYQTIVNPEHIDNFYPYSYNMSFFYIAHMERQEPSTDALISNMLLTESPISERFIKTSIDVINALNWEAIDKLVANIPDGQSDIAYRDLVIMKQMLEAAQNKDTEQFGNVIQQNKDVLFDTSNNTKLRHTLQLKWLNMDLSLSTLYISQLMTTEWGAEAMKSIAPEFWKAASHDVNFRKPFEVSEFIRQDHKLFWELKAEIDEDIAANTEHKFKRLWGWEKLPHAVLSVYFM